MSPILSFSHLLSSYPIHNLGPYHPTVPLTVPTLRLLPGNPRLSLPPLSLASHSSLSLSLDSLSLSISSSSTLPSSFFTISLSSLPVTLTLHSGLTVLGKCILQSSDLPSQSFDLHTLHLPFISTSSSSLPPLLLSLSLLLPLSVPILSPNPRADTIPRYIGHRGLGSSGPHAPWRVPENTPESFLLAAAGGATAVELDVQLTNNGEVVVWHNWKVEGKGIWQVDVDEMRQMVKEEGEIDEKVRKGEVGKRGRGGIWTLEQVLKVLPEEIGVFVEIKYPGKDVAKNVGWKGVGMNETVDKVMAVMEKFGGDRWMKVLCFDPDVAERVALTQNKWGILLSCCETLDRPCEMTDRRCTEVGTAWEWAKRRGFDGLMMFSEVAEKEGVTEWIRETGGSVVTYGKRNGDVTFVREMIERGVQGIIADDVGALIKGVKVEEK